MAKVHIGLTHLASLTPLHLFHPHPHPHPSPHVASAPHHHVHHVHGRDRGHGDGHGPGHAPATTRTVFPEEFDPINFTTKTLKIKLHTQL